MVNIYILILSGLLQIFYISIFLVSCETSKTDNSTNAIKGDGAVTENNGSGKAGSGAKGVDGIGGKDLSDNGSGDSGSLCSPPCADDSPICDRADIKCKTCTPIVGCGGATPICDTNANAGLGACVACLQDSDCSGSKLVCDTVSGTCKTCGATKGCSGDTSYCDTTGDQGSGVCRKPAWIYAGYWTGIWSKNDDYGLSFLVTEDGEVKDFTITDSGPSCGSSGSTDYVEATNAEQGTIRVAADGSFKITVVGCDSSGDCFTDQVTAKLSSNGSAEGTLSLVGMCNIGTFCMGTVMGGGDAQWKAALDCSLQPKKGTSSARYCDNAGLLRDGGTTTSGTDAGATGLICVVSH